MSATRWAERAMAVREAQRSLASASGTARTRALEALASLLEAREEQVLSANRLDVAAAESADLAPALRQRLRLTPDKLATLRTGVEQLATTLDPVGKIARATRLDDGLTLRQVASPVGVLLIIFESRPDAVIQIGSLALRSGNGLLLKGGTEATASNRVLVECLRDALTSAGLDPCAIAGVEGRAAVHDLLALDDRIDLVIPRGSGSLVRAIQSSTRIPVLGHAEGICHLVLDASADRAMAVRLAVDGKCDYPAACNATETLLVHRDALPMLADVGSALGARGVTIKADEASRVHLPAAEPATERDWSTEWGGLTIGIRSVANLDGAIEHIHRYGSGHTEAIVTADPMAATRFQREVDSASVFVNASTRFADGYRYGLGAEVGISTGRIHARGPVGIDGLMTTRWLLDGAGQTVADYGPGKRRFLHQPLPISEVAGKGEGA